VALVNEMIEILRTRNVQITYTSPRPGEKLRKEFFEDDERHKIITHPLVVPKRSPGSASARTGILTLAEHMIVLSRAQNTEGTLKLLYRFVPYYSSGQGVGPA
jgi:hypothetical protein